MPCSTIVAMVLQGQTIPVPVDTEQLAQLASATGGTAYTATSSSALTRAYKDIGRSVGYRTQLREVSAWFIGFGLLLALLAAGASLLWFARIP